MSSRPAKRARLNTDADAIGFSKIPELINSIDPNTIARLLITAAKAHPISRPLSNEKLIPLLQLSAPRS